MADADKVSIYKSERKSALKGKKSRVFTDGLYVLTEAMRTADQSGEECKMLISCWGRRDRRDTSEGGSIVGEKRVYRDRILSTSEGENNSERSGLGNNGEFGE